MLQIKLYIYAFDIRLQVVMERSSWLFQKQHSLSSFRRQLEHFTSRSTIAHQARSKLQKLLHLLTDATVRDASSYQFARFIEP